jgi:hypothetical protein
MFSEDARGSSAYVYAACIIVTGIKPLFNEMGNDATAAASSKTLLRSIIAMETHGTGLWIILNSVASRVTPERTINSDS